MYSLLFYTCLTAMDSNYFLDFQTIFHPVFSDENNLQIFNVIN